MRNSAERVAPETWREEAAMLGLGIAGVAVFYGGWAALWVGGRLVGEPVPVNPFRAFAGLLLGKLAWPGIAADVLALVEITIIAAVGWLGWRLIGPTRPGHASKAEIRRELSLTAARASAAVTRPSMPEPERRRAPLDEVGAPMHRGPIGPLVAPFTNPTGTLAPTQSGKSRGDLVHKVLGAPGALLCSTTKPDLLEFTALARTRRGHLGPVLVFDTTGCVRWPAQLRWSPIQGCTTKAVADRRALAMVEASAIRIESGGGHGGGNDRVFRERATMVMGAYLLAAALGHHEMATVIGWATDRPTSGEAADILHTAGYTGLAANLRAEITITPKTGDSVWLSVRRVVEPLLDPVLLELCSPAPGEGFDAEAHIRAGGSLFLVSSPEQAAATAPLLTALADHWINTARQVALTYPTRRLDPPATVVLDELANGTPVPGLPHSITDTAGRGVVIHWGAQGLAQLETAFGPYGARELLNNTTTLSLWGALKDAETLHWASTIFDHYDRTRSQSHSDGGFVPSRWSRGSESVPVYRPGAVRKIPRGEVLIAHRSLGAIRARAIDVSQRPDWPQIKADIDAVRAGNVPVDALGYRTAPRLPTPSWPVPTETDSW
jgi:hypothetical protein